MTKYMTQEFKASGMECPSCEKIISRTVLKIKGVKEINASYEDAEVKVTYDPKKTSTSEIISKVFDKGYKLSPKVKDNGKIRIEVSSLKNAAVMLGIVAIMLGLYSL
ncbi:MAG: cation transporter, partial [Candidatus Altiarchaeota archaeon]|nr:cation transporter [Candidatus Altiarchaeota archaeon]